MLIITIVNASWGVNERTVPGPNGKTLKAGKELVFEDPSSQIRVSVPIDNEASEEISEALRTLEPPVELSGHSQRKRRSKK